MIALEKNRAVLRSELSVTLRANALRLGINKILLETKFVIFVTFYVFFANLIGLFLYTLRILVAIRYHFFSA